MQVRCVDKIFHGVVGVVSEVVTTGSTTGSGTTSELGVEVAVSSGIISGVVEATTPPWPSPCHSPSILFLLFFDKNPNIFVYFCSSFSLFTSPLDTFFGFAILFVLMASASEIPPKGGFVFIVFINLDNMMLKSCSEIGPIFLIKAEKFFRQNLFVGFLLYLIPFVKIFLHNVD